MYFCVFIKASLCRVSYFVFNPEKPALPTVTKSHKAEIPGWRSFVYSRKDEISAWKLKKTVKNNVVSGSSGSGDPMLWELRGERVNVFPLCYCLVVSTSAINWLERLVSEMTYYVSSGMLKPTHSLTHCFYSLWLVFIKGKR